MTPCSFVDEHPHKAKAAAVKANKISFFIIYIFSEFFLRRAIFFYEIFLPRGKYFGIKVKGIFFKRLSFRIMSREVSLI